MPRAPSWLAVLGVALLGCTHQVRPRLTPRTALGTTGQIDELARLALTLDAAGDRAADTLYASDALVVANARIRVSTPRFAGISYGGRVTIATASVTLEGPFAWVMVDYRWFNLQQNQAESGRATFICQNRGAGWKIVHVHSSQLLPWDR